MDFLQLISSSQDLIWLFGLAAFFAVVFPLAQSTWLFWKQEEFKEKMPFILVELRMPREVRKSPRAMEQILSAIHALRNFAGDFGELWIDGEITRWYSLEMVSFGGEVHFYLRMYKKQRDLIEAAFYSYYPDIEIIEVEDYTKRFPKNVGELYQRGYDMWGSELNVAAKLGEDIAEQDEILLTTPARNALKSKKFKLKPRTVNVSGMPYTAYKLMTER